jgi:cation diffusion facilitator CzcD-associated flavoprotein CzcO
MLPRLRIAIIGAGFSGLGAAVKLQDDNDIVIFEQADEVGGTWRANTYPGCACDIPSNLYSFSFEPNPNWTRAYPQQPEILAYLKRVTDKYNLRPRIRFNTEVTEARWDDATCTWAISCAGQAPEHFDVVVNGTGPLSRPAFPALPGIETFAGTVFHSARWNHDHDLSGKRVAVVGTGASAVQFVPEIAPNVAYLSVFQRTAAWVVPREDRPFTDKEMRRFKRVPLVQRLLRWKIYARQELLAIGFLGKGKGILNKVDKGGREFIAAQIQDPALRRKVTPTIKPGCKRLLLSNDWYPALTRPNVQLVTEGIESVVFNGVRTVDGTVHEADTLIFGTGFAATGFLAPMRVFGRDGVELTDAWRTGARSHLGTTVAGYPNLFLMVGPNTGLGHNSIVFMIEAQLNYVSGAVKHLRESWSKGEVRALDLRADVQAKSYRDIQNKMRKTVWMSGCKSWYQSADGHIDTLWPGFTWDYWRRTRHFQADLFHAVRPITTPQKGVLASL